MQSIGASESEVLALFQRPIYPPNNGYALRAWAWVKAFRSAGVPLHVVVFSTRHSSSSSVRAEKAAVEALGGTYHSLEQNRAINGLWALWGVRRGLPLQVGFYSSPFNKKWVHDYLAKHTISTVFSSCARVGGTWFSHPTVKVYLDLVDDVPAMYRTALPTLSMGLFRWFYTLEHRRLAHWDAQLRQRAQWSYYVFPHSAPKTKCIPNGVQRVLPPPVSAKSMRATENPMGTYYFLGPIAYGPNKVAVNYWHRKVMPMLPASICGKFIGEGMATLPNKSPKAHYFGWVEDLTDLLKECQVCIAPMQSGGGQLNKVIEAMASGRLVVGSKAAMQNLMGLTPGITHIECTTPTEYVRALQWAAEHPAEAEVIAQKGAEAIQKKYTWEAMDQEVWNIVNKNS